MTPDLARPQPEIPPPALTGRVSRAPDALGDPFEVVVPDFDEHHVYEIRRWSPRGVTIPVVGDEVLVVKDELGDAWVPAWWPASGDAGSGVAPPFYTTQPCNIPDLVAVASGDTDFLPGVFVAVEAGETVELTHLRHKINFGTTVTYKLQRTPWGGSPADLSGFTALTAETTPELVDPANVALSDGDRLTLVVTGVSGSPRNFEATLALRHS